VVTGCGYFREASLPDFPVHLVIKQQTDNTKPFILHFFWKRASIELKRSVSYLFLKNLFPALLAVITVREASCLNQDADG
jgi:hypothetical protein